MSKIEQLRSELVRLTEANEWLARELADLGEETDRNATIEECARVADAVLEEVRFTKENDAETALLSVAAAIRALKDKP